MALSLVNKAIVGIVSASSLSGITYGVYSQFYAFNSVKERLIKNLKTPLNLDATKGEDFEAWEELAKQYYGKKWKGKTEIKDLTLTSSKDVDSLKAKCKKLLNVTSKENDFDNSLIDAENWCIKENAPQKVSKLLMAKNKNIPADKNSEDWTAPWNIFKTKHKTEELPNAWNISGWTSIKENPKAPEPFKEKCIAYNDDSLIPNKEESLLLEIISYCTRANG